MRNLLLVLVFVAGLPAAEWKDRAEYDLALEIRAEAAPPKRLALLNQWKAKYPDSQFRQARNELYLAAYQSMGESQKMLATAGEMLATQPDNLVGLYWYTVLLPEFRGPAAEMLALGEKAAGQLLVREKRPDVQLLAHRAQGWIHWQRKQYPEAEQEFGKCLEIDPASPEISAWMGTVLALEAKPDQYPAALWHMARAASYTDTEALPESQRRQMATVLERLYTAYHGDADGLDGLRKAAAGTALPPSGFTVESVAVVTQRKQDEELGRTDPQLAAWVRMRRQLESPDGEKYFAESLQSKPLPRLRGSLVRMAPPEKPAELVIAIADVAAPEIVVKLATPYPNAAEAGAILEFEGTMEAFTKSPFGVIVMSDADRISGWPAPPAKSRR